MFAYFLDVLGHIAQIISHILDEAIWFFQIEYTNNAIQKDIQVKTQVQTNISLNVLLLGIEAVKNQLDTILQASIINISILSFFNY